MAWPSARFKTAGAGGSWTPTDMNGVQDQYIRAAGILNADLSTEVLGPKKTKTITHFTGQNGAGFTPAAFDGLNGDADYAYQITGYMQSSAAATGTDYLQLRPNGLVTNYVNGIYHVVTYGAGSPGHGVFGFATPSGLYLSSYGIAVVHRAQFRATLQAKTGQGRRIWLCENVMDIASTLTPYHYSFSTFWNETTTNITSLQIAWPGLGAVIDGWVSLEKLVEA